MELLKKGFIQTAHSESTKTQAASVNEYEARVFILQVMLGQTIANAKEIAMKVYDETIGSVMAQMADMFCLTVAELTEEIEEYIDPNGKHREGHDEWEDNGEAVTYGFVQRTHFCHMYVGVVASIAVPLLCATVLPVLMKKMKKGHHISTKEYKKAVEKAKKDLSSMVRAKGPRCVF